MTNPATLLVELLDSWEVPAHTTPEDVRYTGPESGEGDPSQEIAFWATHARAVDYVRDIERALTALEESGSEVSFYRDTVPSWYAAIFTYTFPWKTTSNSTNTALISKENRRLLLAVASQIETVGWVPKIATMNVESAREAFTNAEGLVLSDDTLPNEMKRYLLGLIKEAKITLDEYTISGTVPLRRVLMELGGALSTVADIKTEPAEKKKWTATAKAVLLSAVIIGGTKAIESGVDVAAKAITEH